MKEIIKTIVITTIIEVIADCIQEKIKETKIVQAIWKKLLKLSRFVLEALNTEILIWIYIVFSIIMLFKLTSTGVK